MIAINDICNQIQTPAYVFSGSEFKERASRTAGILGPDVSLCYSIKANPFLLAILPEEFSAVEVCSPGELRICMSLGVDPESIIYSGLNKGIEDIRMALEYGAGYITAESLLHLDMINSCASDMGCSAKVLIRASASSQFGIDRHALPRILTGHGNYPSIEFAGLHFFTGTQKHKSKEIIKEVEFLKKYIVELRETSGLALPRIEYGTGLPAFMFADKEINSLDDAYAAELDMLRETAESLKELSQISDLTIEMGRFFAASCGHYFTKVVDTKTNDGVNYAVVDGGSHQLRYFGQMQGMQIPFMDLIKADAAHKDKSRIQASTDNPHIMDSATDLQTDQVSDKWTICGSLCTTADVFARNASFEGEDLAIGDVLAFHQTGAYSLYECMSLFLSRDMPGIYLLKNDGAISCVRGRLETDIFNKGEDTAY